MSNIPIRTIYQFEEINLNTHFTEPMYKFIEYMLNKYDLKDMYFIGLEYGFDVGRYQLYISGTSMFGEPIVDTLLREVEEETGLTIMQYVDYATCVRAYKKMTQTWLCVLCGVSDVQPAVELVKQCGRDNIKSKIGALIYGTEEELREKLYDGDGSLSELDGITNIILVPYDILIDTMTNIGLGPRKTICHFGSSHSLKRLSPDKSWKRDL